MCIILATDETDIESDICGRHPYKEVATEDMETAKILLEVRNGKKETTLRSYKKLFLFTK